MNFTEAAAGGAGSAAAGATPGSSAPSTAATTQQLATCPILHLDLGPLDLNVLGLDIELSRIVLDIVAEPGAGNLLGNFLCAVANLLNNPSGLAQILNQIRAALLG